MSIICRCTDPSCHARKAAQSPAVPTQVHLVILCGPANDTSYAVFSTSEKASDFASSQEVPCVVTHMLVDEPDYGNTRSN